MATAADILRLCRCDAANTYGDGGPTEPYRRFPAKHPPGDEDQLRLAAEASWMYFGNRRYHGGEGKWLMEWLRLYSHADPAALVNANRDAVEKYAGLRERSQSVGLAPGSKFTNDEPEKYSPFYQTGDPRDDKMPRHLRGQFVKYRRALHALANDGGAWPSHESTCTRSSGPHGLADPAEFPGLTNAQAAAYVWWTANILDNDDFANDSAEEDLDNDVAGVMTPWFATEAEDCIKGFRKHASVAERKRAAQAKHQAARETQKQLENERRVRDTISGMVGRVLAAAAVEVSRASQQAEAAKLAPIIALNKRLVRDKMARVDRERRQRAKVV